MLHAIHVILIAPATLNTQHDKHIPEFREKRYIIEYTDSNKKYKIANITIRLTKIKECYYYSRVRSRSKFQFYA